MSYMNSQTTSELLTKFKDYIKVVDKNDELDCYCYTNDVCDSQDISPDMKDTILSYRGLVTDKKGNTVLKSFPFTPEYNVEDTDNYSHIFNLNKNTNVHVFKSYEGCLIRMFYHSNKWYVSTHRKLNAFDSRWGGTKSYGTIFKNTLFDYYDNNQLFRDKLSKDNTTSSLYGKFCNTLNKEKQYMFLLRNTQENRIVCQSPNESRLFHVATIYKGCIDLKDCIDIPKPEEIPMFNDNNELKEYVDSIDIKVNPGVIVFLDNIPLKISNSEYMRLKNIRGNESSIKYRYLQLRCDGMTDELKELYSLYPESQADFNMYESIIEEVINDIHNMYLQKFVFKENINIPSHKYKIMRTAHGWFIQDRDNRRVTKDVICAIVDELPASVLNSIIKKKKTEINYNTNNNKERMLRA